MTVRASDSSVKKKIGKKKQKKQQQQQQKKISKESNEILNLKLIPFVFIYERGNVNTSKYSFNYDRTRNTMTCRSALITAFTIGILLLATRTDYSEACNEAICASVVSKCMLTQSCKCDLVTCTCCKECFSCLSYLYDECCSCVDLCPKPNITDNPLSKKSHVEDFSEPVPGLFQALTAEPDPHERWLTFTYPVDFDMSLFAPKQEKEIKYHMQTAEEEMHPLKPNVMTVNCTVAFMAQCNSWNKCRASCQSMGATSYRWFHDGCCECIGDTCINYGINESRCIHCPMDKEEDDLKDQYDDFGQDEDELTEDEID